VHYPEIQSVRLTTRLFTFYSEHQTCGPRLLTFPASLVLFCVCDLRFWATPSFAFLHHSCPSGADLKADPCSRLRGELPFAALAWINSVLLSPLDSV
jgi:hypothetical protein